MKLDTGFMLAKKLGKETSDPKVAYEFLKTVDAKTLIKNSLWAINTESVNSSIFYYNRLRHLFRMDICVYVVAF